MTEQRTFPLPGSVWNPVGAPDLAGYAPPDRSAPALSDAVLADCARRGVPVVSVIGTVRNERIPFARSWSIWSRQRLPAWLTVAYHVLDDGSDDRIAEDIAGLQAGGAPIVYSRWRDPGDPADRSCTLLFNAAIRQIVPSPLVMVQWWDRIPVSFDHLAALVEPHRTRAGVLPSAISRHVGGSSSMEAMTPAALASVLAMQPWERDPGALLRLAGPIGGHCVPGNATESSGAVWDVREFVALGGYDERYTARAGYSNVELWRRALEAGLVALFPPERVAANAHQSHAASRDAKTTEWLGDRRVARNPEGWGRVRPLEVRGYGRASG